jgi:hypothetical protein
VVVILSACAPSTPSQGEIQTAIAQTEQALPTLTPTFVPTNTPEPSITPKPSNTPKPTNTSLPPTPIPEPVVLTGTGDSVVDFDNPFETSIVHIIGNASSRFFAVQSYGSDGNSIDLLVNTTDPYDGNRPLDFRNGEHTTRFEISSSDEWKIEVLPITSARILTVPGIVEGKGDEVIFLTGATPDLAKIKGNAEGRFFAVASYGKSSDLLVNTTDPYNGTVIVSGDTVVLEIQANGNWSIEIKDKPTVSPTIEPTISSASAPTTPNQIKGLGLTRADAALLYKLFEFNFKLETNKQGEEVYVGTISDKLAIVTLIGPKDNISSISVVINVPKPPTENQSYRMRAYLAALLSAAADGWAESTDWINQSLNKTGESRTTFDNRDVVMIITPEDSQTIVELTIRAK